MEKNFVVCNILFVSLMYIICFGCQPRSHGSGNKERPLGPLTVVIQDVVEQVHSKCFRIKATFALIFTTRCLMIPMFVLLREMVIPSITHHTHHRGPDFAVVKKWLHWLSLCKDVGHEIPVANIYATAFMQGFGRPFIYLFVCSFGDS